MRVAVRIECLLYMLTKWLEEVESDKDKLSLNLMALRKRKSARQFRAPYKAKKPNI